MHSALPTSTKRKRGAELRSTCGCDCDPPDFLKQRYSRSDKKINQNFLTALDSQWTNQKGHSFLQHFPLFILPSWIHHSYPDVLTHMLGIIASDLKKLFYEGISHGRKNFCFAVTASKGDLKWVCKIANLTRSFQNQGRIRDIGCCHECQAGHPGLTWEDLTDQPVWAPSRFTQRPWVNAPPLAAVPFSSSAPEKLYKRDMFHICKVGIYRDHAGSAIVWLCERGYFGQAGDFSEKLNNCHRVFQLYCVTTGQTPALRSFSRVFFNYPRRSAYPWANSKGSDTMILLRFISVQCIGFINAPIDPSHVDQLQLMRQTCQAATKFSAMLFSHGLWLQRKCAMEMQLHLRRFIVGYACLAARTLNDQVSGWGMKPKLHLLKHAHLDLQEFLSNGLERIPNWNTHSCEQDEDQIGRVCRLSRRLDSRRIGERVLQCCLLKSRLLCNRFRKKVKDSSPLR
eukprot:Skav225418  [mRNA]  locus=scaffold2656:823370:824734:- [translate_table: standard]